MKVTTTRNVFIGKSAWGFNPAKPHESNHDEFMLLSGEPEYWAKHGYIQIGTAQLEIEFMNRDSMTTNAVAALRKQKESVLAEAQKEATRIDGEIQNLLAITNDV